MPSFSFYFTDSIKSKIVLVVLPSTFENRFRRPLVFSLLISFPLFELSATLEVSLHAFHLISLQHKLLACLMACVKRTLTFYSEQLVTAFQTANYSTISKQEHNVEKAGASAAPLASWQVPAGGQAPRFAAGDYPSGSARYSSDRALERLCRVGSKSVSSGHSCFWLSCLRYPGLDLPL